jgi:lipopolysaccharide biosynthesis glycosyltransferase
MPLAGENKEKPKLIHYNLSMKPWHYDGIDCEAYFWAYAAKTEFFGEIKKEKENFTPEMAQKDLVGSQKLVLLAQSEADNPDNFIRSVGRSL